MFAEMVWFSVDSLLSGKRGPFFGGPRAEEEHLSLLGVSEFVASLTILARKALLAFHFNCQ